MKKLMVITAFAMLFVGCGVGTYSVQYGVEDVSFISFTDDVKQDITVTVDDRMYILKTVKQKAYKSGRNIKQTALNTIRTTPGQHEVKVMLDGKEVYAKKLFLSTGEHKILEL
jgi:uncharacterized protein YxeA